MKILEVAYIYNEALAQTRPRPVDPKAPVAGSTKAADRWRRC